ncbi:MAG: LamG domain-containing protein [bacterium]|nr:LamG domain-containing protein [bacterium]
MFIGGNLVRENLRGRIDELEIYRRALTETEINDLFIAGTAGKCKPLAEAGDSRSELLWYLFLAALLVGILVVAVLFLLR